MMEMTKCHNKVVGAVRNAIEEYMEERLLLKISDDTLSRQDNSSEEVRSLRQDLNLITRSFGLSNTMLIDISCPSGRVADGANTLEKFDLGKKDKYNKLAQGTSNIRDMYVEIITIIFL
jgi:hypothetical protein